MNTNRPEQGIQTSSRADAETRLQAEVPMHQTPVARDDLIIVLRCPDCGMRWRVPERRSGTNCFCPNCDWIVAVQEATPASWERASVWGLRPSGCAVILVLVGAGVAIYGILIVMALESLGWYIR